MNLGRGKDNLQYREAEFSTAIMISRLFLMITLILFLLKYHDLFNLMTQLFCAPVSLALILLLCHLEVPHERNFLCAQLLLKTEKIRKLLTPSYFFCHLKSINCLN
jgi:hypothetical protein